MKNDILSEYYRPLLERNSFLPIPCPEKFSPAGQCWKIEPEVGGGYYWVYGKQDLYDIKIHDFFFHEDFELGGKRADFEHSDGFFLYERRAEAGSDTSV